MHLVAPGWNVIGGGEPVLPGVSIGHNEYGAWGLTIFGNDNEDLYVYETNPANANEYRYQGRWEAMRVITETIPVKGAKPETVELKYTRHGPVIFEDRPGRRAYAVRAAWMEPGSAPYLASLRMNQARSWEEFREACAFNRMPAENMVWVDRGGTIGWQAAGIQPLRRNWSGLLPVPGDGRYEWDGYLPITALPHEVNPPRGFVVTANHYLFPNDYPWKEALHFTWADPWRASRIAEVLGSGRLFSVAETARLQNDDLSLPARALVPLTRDLRLSEAAARARDALTAWDFVLDKDSVAAGVYAMFQRRLLANVRDRLVPQAGRGAGGAVSLSTKRVIDWLYAPDGRFGDNPTAARDALVGRSLEEAVAELAKRFGPDMSAWKYGQERYHHALIRHPLSAAVNAETRARLDAGPVPRGGDGSTVTATGNGDNQTSGGSFKLIADTEDWDNSIGINTPGQSGDPASPHYRDLFDLWAKGRYFPVAYSTEQGGVGDGKRGQAHARASGRVQRPPFALNSASQFCTSTIRAGRAFSSFASRTIRKRMPSGVTSYGISPNRSHLGSMSNSRVEGPTGGSSESSIFTATIPRRDGPLPADVEEFPGVSRPARPATAFAADLPLTLPARVAREEDVGLSGVVCRVGNQSAARGQAHVRNVGLGPEPEKQRRLDRACRRRARPTFSAAAALRPRRFARPTSRLAPAAPPGRRFRPAARPSAGRRSRLRSRRGSGRRSCRPPCMSGGTGRSTGAGLRPPR